MVTDCGKSLMVARSYLSISARSFTVYPPTKDRETAMRKRQVQIITASNLKSEILAQVTGSGMQSALVGEDLNGCAFVYGSLSFLDKMSCGLVLYFLESYLNTSTNIEGFLSLSVPSATLTRYALGLVPAICAFIAVAVTFSMDLDTPPKALLDPLLV